MHAHAPPKARAPPTSKYSKFKKSNSAKVEEEKPVPVIEEVKKQVIEEASITKVIDKTSHLLDRVRQAVQNSQAVNSQVAKEKARDLLASEIQVHSYTDNKPIDTDIELLLQDIPDAYINPDDPEENQVSDEMVDYLMKLGGPPPTQLSLPTYHAASQTIMEKLKNIRYLRISLQYISVFSLKFGVRKQGSYLVLYPPNYYKQRLLNTNPPPSQPHPTSQLDIRQGQDDSNSNPYLSLGQSSSQLQSEQGQQLHQQQQQYGLYDTKHENWSESQKKIIPLKEFDNNSISPSLLGLAAAKSEAAKSASSGSQRARKVGNSQRTVVSDSMKNFFVGGVSLVSPATSTNAASHAAAASSSSPKASKKQREAVLQEKHTFTFDLYITDELIQSWLTGLKQQHKQQTKKQTAANQQLDDEEDAHNIQIELYSYLAPMGTKGRYGEELPATCYARASLPLLGLLVTPSLDACVNVDLQADVMTFQEVYNRMDHLFKVNSHQLFAQQVEIQHQQGQQQKRAGSGEKLGMISMRVSLLEDRQEILHGIDQQVKVPVTYTPILPIDTADRAADTAVADTARAANQAASELMSIATAAGIKLPQPPKTVTEAALAYIPQEMSLQEQDRRDQQQVATAMQQQQQQQQQPGCSSNVVIGTAILDLRGSIVQELISRVEQLQTLYHVQQPKKQPQPQHRRQDVSGYDEIEEVEQAVELTLLFSYKLSKQDVEVVRVPWNHCDLLYSNTTTTTTTTTTTMAAAATATRKEKEKEIAAILQVLMGKIETISVPYSPPISADNDSRMMTAVTYPPLVEIWLEYTVPAPITASTATAASASSMMTNKELIAFTFSTQSGQQQQQQQQPWNQVQVLPLLDAKTLQPYTGYLALGFYSQGSSSYDLAAEDQQRMMVAAQLQTVLDGYDPGEIDDLMMSTIQQQQQQQRQQQQAALLRKKPANTAPLKKNKGNKNNSQLVKEAVQGKGGGIQAVNHHMLSTQEKTTFPDKTAVADRTAEVQDRKEEYYAAVYESKQQEVSEEQKNVEPTKQATKQAQHQLLPELPTPSFSSATATLVSSQQQQQQQQPLFYQHILDITPCAMSTCLIPPKLYHPSTASATGRQQHDDTTAVADSLGCFVCYRLPGLATSTTASTAGTRQLYLTTTAADAGIEEESGSSWLLHDTEGQGQQSMYSLWWDADCAILNSSNRHEFTFPALAAATNKDGEKTAMIEQLAKVLGIMSSSNSSNDRKQAPVGIDFYCVLSDLDGNLPKRRARRPAKRQGSSNRQGNEEDLALIEAVKVTAYGSLPLEEIYSLMATGVSEAMVTIPLTLLDDSLYTEQLSIEQLPRRELQVRLSYRSAPRETAASAIFYEDPTVISSRQQAATSQQSIEHQLLTSPFLQQPKSSSTASHHPPMLIPADSELVSSNNNSHNGFLAVHVQEFTHLKLHPIDHHHHHYHLHPAASASTGSSFLFYAIHYTNSNKLLGLTTTTAASINTRHSNAGIVSAAHQEVSAQLSPMLRPSILAATTAAAAQLQIQQATDRLAIDEQFIVQLPALTRSSPSAHNREEDDEDKEAATDREEESLVITLYERYTLFGVAAATSYGRSAAAAEQTAANSGPRMIQATDQVIGIAIIDLSLLNSFPLLAGWYHLLNPLQQIIGQVLVEVQRTSAMVTEQQQPSADGAASMVAAKADLSLHSTSLASTQQQRLQKSQRDGQELEEKLEEEYEPLLDFASIDYENLRQALADLDRTKEKLLTYGLLGVAPPLDDEQHDEEVQGGRSDEHEEEAEDSVLLGEEEEEDQPDEDPLPPFLPASYNDAFQDLSNASAAKLSHEQAREEEQPSTSSNNDYSSDDFESYATPPTAAVTATMPATISKKQPSESIFRMTSIYDFTAELAEMTSPDGKPAAYDDDDEEDEEGDADYNAVNDAGYDAVRAELVKDLAKEPSDSHDYHAEDYDVVQNELMRDLTEEGNQLDRLQEEDEEEVHKEARASVLARYSTTSMAAAPPDDSLYGPNLLDLLADDSLLLATAAAAADDEEDERAAEEEQMIVEDDSRRTAEDEDSMVKGEPMQLLQQEQSVEEEEEEEEEETPRKQGKQEEEKKTKDDVDANDMSAFIMPALQPSAGPAVPSSSPAALPSSHVAIPTMDDFAQATVATSDKSMITSLVTILLPPSSSRQQLLLPPTVPYHVEAETAVADSRGCGARPVVQQRSSNAAIMQPFIPNRIFMPAVAQQHKQQQPLRYPGLRKKMMDEETERISRAMKFILTDNKK